MTRYFPCRYCEMPLRAVYSWDPYLQKTMFTFYEDTTEGLIHDCGSKHQEKEKQDE
jgi:hypothetical protein